MNGNGDDEITYTVNWSDGQGGSDSMTVAPGRPTSVTIAPITLGAKYAAMVTAKNKAGSSGRSEPGRVSPYTAPGVVSKPEAAATGTAGQVTLAWSAPEDNGRPITGYQYHNGDGQWVAVGADQTSADRRRSDRRHRLRFRGQGLQHA